jgi:serine/threonine-protein kinase
MVGRTISHYKIVEKLGEGGMGVVYKAHDSHLDRTVAIKVLPPQKVADPESKRRFVQEAKAASALNHPNIVTVHDAASDAGLDFIVMEFIVGKTLREAIGKKGLKLDLALKYGAQIADALAAAHAAGLVHRDLKPGNVMVTDKGW